MVFNTIPPTDKEIILFKKGLWKERRRLQFIDKPEHNRIIRKHFLSDGERYTEANIFQNLAHGLGNRCVPNIYETTSKYIDIEYIEGIRLHRAFSILLDLENERNTRNIRKTLLNKSIGNAINLQRFMCQTLDFNNSNIRLYEFKKKIYSLLNIFAHCLELKANNSRVIEELERAENYIQERDILVPFRDASPKNMIIEWKEAWLGNVTPEEQVNLFIEVVKEHSYRSGSPLLSSPIVNIDFSSCYELTVPEDDPISLLLHESSWMGEFPKRSQLLWLPIEHDDFRLSLGLVGRLYRFGGRRLAYKLVHKSGFDARYNNESILYYFNILSDIEKIYNCNISKFFPEIMNITNQICERLKNGIVVEKDWFLEKYNPNIELYYRDVYPF